MPEIKIKFNSFIEMFPVIDLPITLNDEIHHIFSKNNKPLPAPFIKHFILPLEEEESEHVEFIPCFSIPETSQFKAIVYWKARLMEYLYTLVTFTNKGEFIDKRAIGGTFFDGKKLTQSIATIDEDWEILIATGQSSKNVDEFDPAASKAFKLELLPDGYIVNI